MLVVGVAAELVDVVFEGGDDGRGSVLEQELYQVEGLDEKMGTLSTLRHVLFFFSFSQMKSLIFCHFSLR